MLTTFVINLDRDTHRMDALHDHLVHCGLDDYERVSADSDFAEDMPEWMKYSCPKNVNGCFSSHRKIWKEIVSRGLDWALVLEDDVRFTKDAPEVLDKALMNLPRDFDLLYLGCTGECTDTCTSHVGMLHSVIGFRKVSSKDVKDKEGVTVPKAPYGTHAYIITRKCAEKLLDLGTFPGICHVDVFMGNVDGLAVYACDPVIANQERIQIKSTNVVDFPRFFNKLLGNPYEMNIKNFTFFGTVTITNFVIILGILVRFFPWLLVFLIPDLAEDLPMVISVLAISLLTSLVVSV